MLKRNYLGAIETLNKFQNPRPKHASLQTKYDKLGEMKKYLDRCDIRQEKLDNLPIIHVTGTHGKGSTCFYCERILHGHGYRTGFYSSPHLLAVRERIRIDGKPVSEKEFSENFWEVYDKLEKHKEEDDDMPLYFAFLTILAFQMFLRSKVDVAVIEVGIGGQNDCTNVIRSPVAVGITPISIDHTAQLGTTEESIAWHKGGIMKAGSVAFTVPQPESVLKVLQDRSNERNCSLTVLRKISYALDGESKLPNHIKDTVVPLAVALSEAFVKNNSSSDQNKRSSFSLELALRSMETSRWPGRYDIKQMRNLRFFLDGAHTRNSIRTTADWFSEQTKTSPHPKVLVFNLTGKRDPEIFMRELLSYAFHLAIFIPNVGYEKEIADTANFKMTNDEQLALCKDYGRKWLELQLKCGKEPSTVKVFPSFAKAVNFLTDQERYDVLVTGSLYLVGAALSVVDPTLNGTLVE